MHKAGVVRTSLVDSGDAFLTTSPGAGRVVKVEPSTFLGEGKYKQKSEADH